MKLKEPGAFLVSLTQSGFSGFNGGVDVNSADPQLVSHEHNTYGERQAEAVAFLLLVIQVE